MESLRKLIKKGRGNPGQPSPSGADQTGAHTAEHTVDEAQAHVATSSRALKQTSSSNPPDAAVQAPKDFPTGIKEWWAPPDVQSTVLDLVFVHGITGSREGTWTSEGSDTPWPKSFIPPLLPNVRILGFGYAADVTHWWKMVNQGRLYDYGKSLLNGLYAKRSINGLTNRPIAFVVHSLGGLVCESCLTLSNDSASPHLRTIVENTVAIAFLGTPHAGAGSLADWATKSARALGLAHNVNDDIVAVLRTDSEVLAILQQGFHTMLKVREPEQIDITCFFEQKELPFVGYVVPPHSAVLTRWNNVPLDKNHMTMTKFESDEDPDFTLVFSEIWRWVSDIEAKQILQQETIRRKLITQAEFAAAQYATNLDFQYDSSSDAFTISIASRLFVEENDHIIPFSNHSGRLPSQLINSYSISGWLTLLQRFRPKKYDPDPRCETIPLSLIPFIDNRFLARVPTRDVYRILASQVSERYSQNSAVLVHNTFFSISPQSHANLPIILVRYVDDSHVITGTRLPNTDFCNAIASNAGLTPSLSFPILFKCTLPGHETVAMPYLMALIDLHRHDVLFPLQFDRTLTIWKAIADLLDIAWDDDDAWECTPDQIPIRELVMDYRRMARVYNFGYQEMMLLDSKLRTNCFDYFEKNPDLDFENEDIRNRLKGIETLAAPPGLRNKEQVLEQWYSLYGLEVSRWILLALTLTLGSNLSKAWTLPMSFEVLREHSTCYVN